MATYRIQTTVTKEGSPTINGLPFMPGEKADITVRASKREAKRNGRYPLRGKTVR